MGTVMPAARTRRIQVVEHLRKDEVGACVDLLFQVLHFQLRPAHGFGVSFRKASDGNREVVAVVLADVLDKLKGMREAGCMRFPGTSCGRWITTQGQHVAASEFFGLT